MTFKRAKELSIMKWEWFSKHGRLKYELDSQHNDRMLMLLPQLKGLSSSCGFCEFFGANCNFCQCPLEKKWGENCFRSTSLFYRWQNSLNNKQSKKLAKQILEDIKSCEAG